MQGRAFRAKDMPNSQQLKTWITLYLALASLAAGAAEIRGSVAVQRNDLFSDRGGALEEFPVSVALYPAEGQPVPRRTPTWHEVSVSGSRIQPLYLAVNRGDRVRFRGQDGIFHELFSHSKAQPFEVRLDRAGLQRESSLNLTEVADLHWFCRIHAKSYARIDVLDTSLVRMLRAGDSFEFRDLAPGKWLLRVAAPGAETRTLEATAMTAPPPLRVELDVKGFGLGLEPPRSVTVDELFPSRPGP